MMDYKTPFLTAAIMCHHFQPDTEARQGGAVSVSDLQYVIDTVARDHNLLSADEFVDNIIKERSTLVTRCFIAPFYQSFYLCLR